MSCDLFIIAVVLVQLAFGFWLGAWFLPWSQQYWSKRRDTERNTRH